MGEIRRLVAEFAQKKLPGRWLAMHIRRSDKEIETPENVALSISQAIEQAHATCKAWQCSGIFVCSDDWWFKESICSALQKSGIRTAVYGPLLSSNVSQNTHMNPKLHPHRKAWDAVFEVCVMSFGCCGLLCTHSFMANMVVYFSPPTYPYRTFWDPHPAPIAQAGTDVLQAEVPLPAWQCESWKVID